MMGGRVLVHIGRQTGPGVTQAKILEQPLPRENQLEVDDRLEHECHFQVTCLKFVVFTRSIEVTHSKVDVW